MKITFKKAMIMRGYFFAGRPEEKANLVCRVANMFGYYLLVVPNTYLGKRPKDGEEWRFAIDSVEADSVTMTARAICIPTEKVGDVSKVEIGSRMTVRTTKAPANPAEAARTIASVLSAPAPRPQYHDAQRESRRKGRHDLQPKKGSHEKSGEGCGDSKDARRRQRRLSRQKGGAGKQQVAA